MLLLLVGFVLLAPATRFPLLVAQGLGDHLQAAAEYLKKGRLTQAEAEAEVALKENSGSGEAYNLLGQIFTQEKRLSEAEEMFVKAIRFAPALPDAYENLSLLELLQGKDSEAELAAQKLLGLDPRNYNGHLVLGIAGYNQRRYSQSLKAFGCVSPNLTTDDPLALAVCIEDSSKLGLVEEAGRLKVRLGKTHIQLNDALLAADLFRAPELQEYVIQWLQTDRGRGGDSYRLSYELGQAYRRAGQLKSAEKYYSEALSQKPSDARVLLQLAAVKEDLGDSQAATDYFYRAKKAPKSDFPTLVYYGLLCLGKRLFFDAREAFEQALALQPGDMSARYLLGIAAYSADDVSAAERQFRSILALRPTDVGARLALGVVLLSTSRRSEARKEFEAVLKTDGSSGAAHYYLAQIYRREGKVLDAREELEKAIRLSPRDAHAYADLGGLEIADGHLEAARQALETALRLDNNSSTAHYHLGTLLRKQGKLEQAQREFQIAQKLHTEEEKTMMLVAKDSKEYEQILRLSH